MYTPFSLNVRGRLLVCDRPAVMGIINATPDSFYAGSRAASYSEVAARAARLVAEGADMLDLGAYSSRPGAEDIPAAEEWARLAPAIEAVRSVAPDVPLSVDTFRAEVARRAVEAGADIVNDIGGGTLDPEMFAAVAELRVPYVLMHMRGTPATMQRHCDYGDVAADVLGDLSRKLHELSLLGVCDVIVDPGFGFSKTLDQNYRLLDALPAFKDLGCPLLVGVSRKSMVTRLPQAVNPEAAPIPAASAEALNGTTAINALALDRGAQILRVHDVAEARQTVDIYTRLTRN